MASEGADRSQLANVDEILTLSETAVYLKLGERTVHRMIKRNEVPCVRVGSQWRFMKSVLDDWLLSGMQVFPRNELAPFLDATNGIVRLAPLIETTRVVDRVVPGEPAAVLRQVAAPLTELGLVRDLDAYVGRLLARERLSSTALGHGVAVPHVRRLQDNPSGAPSVVLGVCREGVPFGAPNNDPVHFFFLLSASSEVIHLRVLKRITLMFREQAVRDALLATTSKAELLDVLATEEDRLFPGG